VEIIFRKKDSAPIFRDEGVVVSQLSAGLIHLEASAAGKPNGRNAAVIERSGELVESGNAFSVGRNEVVNRDVQNEGSLMQTILRFTRFPS
jgi:hypothetical protein